MPACGSCGYSRIENDAKFCPRCGAPLAESNASALPMGASPDALAEPKSNQEIKESETARWESPPNAGQDKSAADTNKTAPKIGGWLYIPAVILALMLTDPPFRLFKYLDDMKYLFSISSYFSIYYLASIFFFFALALFALISYFRKKKFAPLLFLGFLWTEFANILVHDFWFFSLFDKAPYVSSDLFMQIFMIVYLAMAIAYTIAFRRSDRAKATFIN